MNAARTLLERLSRGRVLRRRLPTEFGGAPMLVSPDASLSYWKPGLRSDLFEFADEFVDAGSVVWDIGANVGLLTMAAAQRSGAQGQVVAVEADTWLAALVARSAAMQPETSAPIQVVPAAVYSELGVGRFHVAQRGRAMNHLEVAGGAPEAGGVRATMHLVTITLDWLLQQGRAPQVVKVDVEGAEADVLNGAQRLLAEVKPVILCEVYEKNAESVTRTLREHGYALYDWESHPRARVERACYNTLALPEAR